MFLTRYEDTNIIYFVDKKVQPGYEKPRIILGKGRFDDFLFNGTILDGEMVKDSQGGWIYLINDLIALQGRMLLNMILPARIQAAYDVFKNNYRADDLLDVCLYQIKKYYPCASSVVDELVTFSQSLPYTNRGIYFWPQSLKFKPKLYNFNEELIKTVIRKVKDNPEFQNMKESPPPPMSSRTLTDTPVTVKLVTDTPVRPSQEMAEHEKVLILRKTENPDVYDIYDGSVKCGIAHVATLKTSKLLRAVFKDLTVAVSQPFVCTYKKEFDKWEPIRLHVT
jgi:hypothetical protein